MKKLFTLVLTLAALLSSTQAWAEDYDLYVGGTRVTDANASNITSSAITSGSVKYYPSSKQLLITDGTVITYNGDCISSGIDGLTIIFSGSATITTTHSSAAYTALYLKAKTYLSGYQNTKAPVVTLEATNGGRAISTNSPLYIYGNRITAKSANEVAVFGRSAEAALDINFSQLTATGGSDKAGIQGFSGGIGLYGSVLKPEQTISGGAVMQNGSAAQTAYIYCAATIGSFNVPTSYTATLSTSNTGATTASGTAQYNRSTKTLTLTNVNVDGANLVTRGDMTVNFVGGGTISSAGYPMDLYGNTSLTSDGTVVIKSTAHTPVYLNYNNTNLEVCMPEFQATCTSDKDGVYGGNNCKLILKKYNDNSVYKFLGGRSNVNVGQIVFDNMDIWSVNTWIKEGKVYYNDAIASSSNGPASGTWFASKNQFTYYPVYVAGTQVNHRNYENIRNQYITSGTVSYSNSSKTLTLNGVTIKVTDDEVNAIKTTSGAGDITITAVGNNTLTSVTNAAELRSNTTFTSSSYADLRFISNNKMGISKYGSANVTVDMVGFFQAKGAMYGFYGDGSSYPSEVLTLKKQTSDIYGYNFYGDEGAIRNVGDLVLDNMDFWYTTYGCYWDKADKRVETNGGAIAKGQVVFGSIKEKLPVYVCGKQLNRVNDASNPIYVGSKYISSGTQSVGYVPSTKTLTLNGAKIDRGSEGINCIMSSVDGLIVDVTDNCELKADGGGWTSTNFKDNTTIKGSGTLNLTGSKGGLYFYGNSKTLTINDVNVNVEYDTYGDSTGKLAINLSSSGKEVTLKKGVYSWNSISLGENTSIVEPFKAYVDDGAIKVGSSNAQNVVITKVDKYDLAVCDIDVNSYNKDDILRDGGSFKYDPNMKRLTITNANVDDTSVQEGIWNKGIEGLNIAINGENKLKFNEDVFNLKKPTTFSGNGSVKGELTSSSGYGIYLPVDGIICNLNGPKFEFTGKQAVGDGGFDANLIFEKGCMIFNPINSNSRIFNIKNLTLGDGMIIAEPKGGTFDSSKKGIVVNGSLYYGHAVITMKGDVNLDGQVTIADGVAVLNAMAGDAIAGDADVNGDGDITIADFVAVLNIMAN
ncbi:MAG: dockerin type I repeat-containing protein [Bacteroidaceae bacterium]|nr:dockerin type I repeat-containing protein [Bacteroidaceae bacterium]